MPSISNSLSQTDTGTVARVTIDLEAYEQLPARQLRAMLRILRFADAAGVMRASLSMLAMPGLSRSALHRDLGDLEAAGHIERQEEGGYRIARRYCPSCRDGVPADETTPVPQLGTPDSRARPTKNLSSDLRSSERELSLQGEIPDGWQEAAAAERHRAGLAQVDLGREWRKFALYFADQGRPIRLGSWLLWAVRTRLDHTNTPQAAPVPAAPGAVPIGDNLPGDERQQRQARDWAATGFWLRSGMWGPAPDQPDCMLPAGLVAWCREERAARVAVA